VYRRGDARTRFRGKSRMNPAGIQADLGTQVQKWGAGAYPAKASAGER